MKTKERVLLADMSRASSVILRVEGRVDLGVSSVTSVSIISASDGVI